MKRKDTQELSFLYGANSSFLEELYLSYREDPEAVDPSWKAFFSNYDDTPHAPFTWKEPAKTDASSSSLIDKSEILTLKIKNLVDAFREYGHNAVATDPLGLKTPPSHPSLALSYHNISEKDLDIVCSFPFGAHKQRNMKIREGLLHIKSVYAGNVGVEYHHIENQKEIEWLQNRLEVIENPPYPAERKKHFLEKLIQVEGFEQFLHTKFPGAKRFSVEGGENMILSIEAMIETSGRKGVSEVIIGMAHRGRLNVLTNIMGKSYASMLSEFQGNTAYPEGMDILGDVKYHLGYSSDRILENDHKIHLSLTPNPSHLEAANPVVTGKVRARQDLQNDTQREKVLGLLIHGDAAFSGQGVVVESLSLGGLEGYHTGGTLHIVINNQIGFTANMKEGSPYKYVTDVAKSCGAPIFHINGDNTEDIIRISEIAADYRHIFKKDVVLDIVCYRKYGHNEGDEPVFTQPVMYKKIEEKETPPTIYLKQLEKEGMDTAQFIHFKKDFTNSLETEYQKSLTFKPRKADWKEGHWATFTDATEKKTTSISVEALQAIGKVISTKPEKGEVNYKILRQLEARKKTFEAGKNMDWATGEALAYGSLLLENIPVRLSGQDAARGTFSHRHAIWVNPNTEERYCALNHLSEKQARFEVINSNLSEYAVLGFEYGYSISSPYQLTIWEAQFGDFANGAQIMIDQFISSGETKWLRMSGLIMLLPHGHEGAGPEHSSARVERFLQLCANDNMRVVSCTNPANFFHAIRRQMRENTRKPLIVMSPKYLLRHKLVVSSIEDFTGNTIFQPVIDDVEKQNLTNVKKVIMCSGKIYYDLFEEREKIGIKNIALVRIEQYHPFPHEELAILLKSYPDAQISWCQEEPSNMGAWTYISPHIKEVLKNISHKNDVSYEGRKACSSPAEGYAKHHTKEQNRIIKEALTCV